MKTIIAGSRSIDEMAILLFVLEKCRFTQEITAVISGGASGVDRLGEIWARTNSLPIISMKADWGKYGKRAGFLRNAEMALAADACICIWDGVSPGTKNMMDLARKRGLKHCFWNNAGFTAKDEWSGETIEVS